MSLFRREAAEVAPGAVHTPDWLSIDQQREIVLACQEWLTGGYSPTVAFGKQMSVKMACLGWQWVPYRYEPSDLQLPDWLVAFGRKAVGRADYKPDAAIVNYYDANARMGMHQDKDEKLLEPVVSLSLGDSCLFRFGNTENRNKPYTDLELHSGDLFVFGGTSRLAYHGVTRILPNTGPDVGLVEGGRINITLRMTGFTA